MKSGQFKPGHATVAVVLLAMTGCNPSPTSGLPQILLFDGTGTSPNGVAVIEKILKDRSLDYAKANSEQLNGLTLLQLPAYRLLIVPGGNYLTIGKSLTTNATVNVRNAVQNGWNYLGICAGGILAGNASNNLNLISGAHAAATQGIHKTDVVIAAFGSPAVEHYWEDDPQFTCWGAVVGNYPMVRPPLFVP